MPIHNLFTRDENTQIYKCSKGAHRVVLPAAKSSAAGLRLKSLPSRATVAPDKEKNKIPFGTGQMRTVSERQVSRERSPHRSVRDSFRDFSQVYEVGVTNGLTDHAFGRGVILCLF